MWLDSETVIFNVYNVATDRYRARLVTCDGTHQEDLPIPVQEVDGRGRVYALSYEALASIRPDYGYRNHQSELRSLFDNAIDHDEPKTGQIKRVLEIGTLVDHAASRHGIEPTRFKLNHIMSSPDSGKIVFLFRYFLGSQRVTDLFSYDLEQNHYRLEIADSGLSHACWWDS